MGAHELEHKGLFALVGGVVVGAKVVAVGVGDQHLQYGTRSAAAQRAAYACVPGVCGWPAPYEYVRQRNTYVHSAHPRMHSTSLLPRQSEYTAHTKCRRRRRRRRRRSFEKEKTGSTHELERILDHTVSRSTSSSAIIISVRMGVRERAEEERADGDGVEAGKGHREEILPLYISDRRVRDDVRRQLHSKCNVVCH